MPQLTPEDHPHYVPEPEPENGPPANWIPGDWYVDPTHSQITFTVRHALVPVRCAFLEFRGDIRMGETFEDSEVHVEVKASSFTSGFEYRDNRVRTFDDLLDTGRHPTLTYDSVRVTKEAVGGEERYRIAGDLQFLGVKRPVDLDVEFLGIGRMDQYGTRAGFIAHARLDRRDFGLVRETPLVHSERTLGDGNRLLGWTIEVEIHLEAVLAEDAGRYGISRLRG
jgi:polyisoprenoid-binding protein YceI